MERLSVIQFYLNDSEGYFVEVIKDAKDFYISSNKDLNYSELVFSDPTNCCRIEDAPMFEGVYEINGRIQKDGKEYIVITKTHFPKEELSYEERINWYYQHVIKTSKKLKEKPTLEDLLKECEGKNIDYLPIPGTKYIDRVPRYLHEDRTDRKRPRINSGNRELSYEERITWFFRNYYETGMELPIMLETWKVHDLDNFEWYGKKVKIPKYDKDL